MSRLAFAAGRGARIQFRTSTNRWIHSHSLPLFQNNRFRIHPADAHLEYGPVSSALREAAAGNSWEYLNEHHQMALAVLRHGAWYWTDADDRSLFMLLMAESLADEGM